MIKSNSDNGFMNEQPLNRKCSRWSTCNRLAFKLFPTCVSVKHEPSTDCWISFKEGWHFPELEAPVFYFARQSTELFRRQRRCWTCFFQKPFTAVARLLCPRRIARSEAGKSKGVIDLSKASAVEPMTLDLSNKFTEFGFFVSRIGFNQWFQLVVLPHSPIMLTHWEAVNSENFNN